MYKKFWLLVIAMILGGCATMDMQAYVGKDIRDVMVDYGPPVHQFNMGDGVRAFQWEIIGHYRQPVTASTTGFINGPRHGGGVVNSNTTYIGGETYTSRCFYTYFAKWNEISKRWIITGFRKPISGC